MSRQAGDNDFDLYCVSNSKGFKVKEPEFGRPVEYPFTWFETMKTKPRLSIALNPVTQLDDARIAAVDFLTGEKTPPAYVVEYLYHYCRTLKETLTEDWKSYSLVIGRKDDVITPLNLLELSSQKMSRTYSSSGPSSYSKESDHYLVGYLLCSYRYNRTHEKMQAAYSNKVTSIMATYMTIEAQSIRLATFLTNSRQLIDYPSFEILASALDMFLERFPNNIASKLRLGTIGLRYQGCSGLVDLTYFKNILKKKELKASLEWLFADCLVSEIFQVMVDSKDEVSVKHSYFPYMIGMKLSEKSPYSASSNPSIHTLVHIVGTLFGAPRSINAIMIEYGALTDIVVNAGIIFFAHRGNVGTRVQFSSKQVMDEIKADEENEKTHMRRFGAGDPLEIITPTDPRGWLAEYQDRDYKFNREEILDISKVLDGITIVRTGTVGEWMKSNFIPCLPKEKY